jgi:Aldo/keto reductase family
LIDHLTGEVHGDALRRALAPYADDIVLVSKVGADHIDAPFPLKPAQQPRELRASVEDNLASLGVERLAVVNLRRLDIQPGLVATGDQVVDLDDQLAELVALREEDKIGAIGLSNVRLDQLQQALGVGIACVQNAYSLVERSGEPMLDLCAQEGVAWVPFFPLGSAFPGRPKVTDQPAVIEAARALGVRGAFTGRLDTVWPTTGHPDLTGPLAEADEAAGVRMVGPPCTFFCSHSFVHGAPTTTIPGGARPGQRGQPCDARGGWGIRGLTVQLRAAHRVMSSVLTARASRPWRSRARVAHAWV